MAEILPIRAWRYHPDLSKRIDDLTAPLFDVVSENQRKALYQNPLNSIHLSVPKPPDAATRAALLLAEWKANHILVQDLLPTIYVYYQHFQMAGDRRNYCRKGFICHVRAYDWAENVVLRHENTIPKAVNDRVELSITAENVGDARHPEWGPAASRVEFERAYFAKVLVRL